MIFYQCALACQRSDLTLAEIFEGGCVLACPWQLFETTELFCGPCTWSCRRQQEGEMPQRAHSAPHLRMFGRVAAKLKANIWVKIYTFFTRTRSRHVASHLMGNLHKATADAVPAIEDASSEYMGWMEGLIKFIRLTIYLALRISLNLYKQSGGAGKQTNRKRKCHWMWKQKRAKEHAREFLIKSVREAYIRVCVCIGFGQCYVYFWLRDEIGQLKWPGQCMQIGWQIQQFIPFIEFLYCRLFFHTSNCMPKVLSFWSEFI